MTRSSHIDRVMQSLSSGSAAARSRLAASWLRSAKNYGLDPAMREMRDSLDSSSLRGRREAMDRVLHVAAPKLDNLFGLIGHSGCGVLLTDADGIVLEKRCSDADSEVFKEWRLWPGHDWSEAAEGTNGIGTCLAEQRQITIHRTDHFMAKNIAMSCMDAPIFGPDGALIAALDVSSARADQTEGYNRLIGAMVVQTAQQIEAEVFRSSFAGKRILVAEGDATGAALLAVDGDDIVVGATRAARKAFGLNAMGRLAPRPAVDLLGRDGQETGFDRGEKAAVKRALVRAEGNVSAAARALGIGRATMYRRMKRLGLSESGADLSQ